MQSLYHCCLFEKGWMRNKTVSHEKFFFERKKETEQKQFGGRKSSCIFIPLLHPK